MNKNAVSHFILIPSGIFTNSVYLFNTTKRVDSDKFGKVPKAQQFCSIRFLTAYTFSIPTLILSYK
jgi:hypothetical protein